VKAIQTRHSFRPLLTGGRYVLDNYQMKNGLPNKIYLQTTAAMLAQDLLDGNGDYLTCVCKLSCTGNEISPSEIDIDFRVFIIISSETDHLPLPDTRKYCAESWLQQCDKNLAKVIEFYRTEVEQSCLNIIKRFGASNGELK
jgi:hypothetical protein